MHRAIAYRDPSQENNENFEPPANIGSMFCWVYFLKEKGKQQQEVEGPPSQLPRNKKKKEEGYSSDSGATGQVAVISCGGNDNNNDRESSALFGSLKCNFFFSGWEEEEEAACVFPFLFELDRTREKERVLYTTSLRGGFLSSATTTIDGPAAFSLSFSFHLSSVIVIRTANSDGERKKSIGSPVE